MRLRPDFSVAGVIPRPVIVGGVAITKKLDLLFQLIYAEARVNAETGRLFLWVPVFLGLGVATYFALPVEPLMISWLAAACVLAFAAIRLAVHPLLGRLFLALALLTGGVALAAVRTAWVEAPVLAKDLSSVEVQGTLLRREWRGDRGWRLILAPDKITKLTKAETPKKISLIWRGQQTPPPTGSVVTVRATLWPPDGPRDVGGYNPARTAYFQQIGAFGFAYAVPIAEAKPADLDFSLWIENIRALVTARIYRALPGDTGGIAAALITGERGAISEATNEVYRVTGLTHVLSISGLHMALFGGALFLSVRLLLVIIPHCALFWPLKKIAAAVALAGSFCYLLLSGSEVAAERSFIMLAVMLIAILLNRPALSLRNLALAATLVLLHTPESLAGPSFQMSFAATLALLVFFDFLRSRRSQNVAISGDGLLGSLMPQTDSLPLKAFWVVGMAAATTVVASLATAPFGAFYFNRVSLTGLVANVLTAPLTDYLVMPSALLTLVLMPFGLEYLPLYFMGKGIDWTMHIAQWVARWPQAQTSIASFQPFALFIICVGGLWFCLWAGRLRLFGLFVIAVGLVCALLAKQPDLLIAANGRAVMAVDTRGTLRVVATHFDEKTVQRWYEKRGLPSPQDLKTLYKKENCDDTACISRFADNKTFSLVRDVEAIAEECRSAHILITTLVRPDYCPAPVLVIDKKMLRERGALAVYWKNHSYDIIGAKDDAAARPWASKATLK